MTQTRIDRFFLEYRIFQTRTHSSAFSHIGVYLRVFTSVFYFPTAFARLREAKRETDNKTISINPRVGCSETLISRVGKREKEYMLRFRTLFTSRREASKNYYPNGTRTPSLPRLNVCLHAVCSFLSKERLFPTLSVRFIRTAKMDTQDLSTAILSRHDAFLPPSPSLVSKKKIPI